MKEQAVNPFLPLNVYIPDGEPHVFGDRVYLFGSHDEENGDTYCKLPYVVYSAPTDDLSDWTVKGISYEASQDPLCCEERHYMYAPDVVRGNDGRFYLYYALAGNRGSGGYWGPISVAVCDEPDGKYEYLGAVRNPDGTPYNRYVLFDPAVINDDGTIRLYYGTLYPFLDRENFLNRGFLRKLQQQMFRKSPEEIMAEPDGVMGPITVTLADDMMTVTSEPKRIAPARVKKTLWEGHAFFEGASIRKIKDTYYFIYSSALNHELCYATSKYPDRDFTFRGTIVSTGDVGYQGRQPKDRLNHTGTTHGSIECVNGQWYVFYHRLTHKSDYSRQACAEPIQILSDGSIPQVPVSSCGLNGGALKAEGTYSAGICCVLTNGHMPHGGNKRLKKAMPYIVGEEGTQCIRDIADGTWMGFRDFDFRGATKITLRCRGKADGKITFHTDMEGAGYGECTIRASENWKETAATVRIAAGRHPLYLHFTGTGSLELLDMTLQGE